MNIGDLLNISGAGIMKTLVGVAWTVGSGLLLLVIVWWIYAHHKNKNTYVHPIRLIRVLDNGVKKEMNNLRGGKIGKGGITDFAIKIPRKFKKIFLGYTPDFSKMDADSRLVFLSIGDGKSLQQVEETIIKTEKDGETEYSLIMKPIRTDVKNATLNNLRNWREVLDTKKLTAFTLSLGAIIIMIIAHLISLYIQTKIRCPALPA